MTACEALTELTAFYGKNLNENQKSFYLDAISKVWKDKRKLVVDEILSQDRYFPTPNRINEVSKSIYIENQFQQQIEKEGLLPLELRGHALKAVWSVFQGMMTETNANQFIKYLYNLGNPDKETVKEAERFYQGMLRKQANSLVS